MGHRRDDDDLSSFPDEVRHLPVQTQVAVLYERVKAQGDQLTDLKTEVRALKRATYAFVSSLFVGMLLYLFSLSSGWIGNTRHAAEAVRQFLGV